MGRPAGQWIRPGHILGREREERASASASTGEWRPTKTQHNNSWLLPLSLKGWTNEQEVAVLKTVFYSGFLTWTKRHRVFGQRLIQLCFLFFLLFHWWMLWETLIWFFIYFWFSTTCRWWRRKGKLLPLRLPTATTTSARTNICSKHFPSSHMTYKNLRKKGRKKNMHTETTLPHLSSDALLHLRNMWFSLTATKSL